MIAYSFWILCYFTHNVEKFVENIKKKRIEKQQMMIKKNSLHQRDQGEIDLYFNKKRKKKGYSKNLW